MMVKTVLLVEDEPALRGLIRRMLAGVGYAVVEAKNGADALHLYKSAGADLVITDVHMPWMDGVTLAHELWAGGKRPQLLVMSARPLEGDLPPGSTFLRKPFTRDHLLATVRLITLKPAGAPQ